MRLLSLFTTPSSEERGVIPVVATFVSNDGWLLNTLVRLWDATASNDTQFHHVENPSLFLLPFLDFVRSLCNRVTKAKSYSSIQSRASLLRSQLLLNFLCHEPLPLDPLVETWICLTLFDLVFQNRKSRSGCESVSQNNLPVLLDAREDQKRVDGFGRDLQVCLRKCGETTAIDTCSLQHALAIVIRLLDSNSHSNSETLLGSQSESFENADLQRICRSHFCESGLDLGHEDHFRAPKRARLSVTNGDNKARDGRSHVVKRIYSLLGLQESTVSTGLSQVTE